MTHQTTVAFQPGPNNMQAFWAWCSCGWQGQTQTAREPASCDGAEHERTTAIEGTQPLQKGDRHV
jgi:hypothetical protein